jgi:hypothetical protein
MQQTAAVNDTVKSDAAEGRRHSRAVTVEIDKLWKSYRILRDEILRLRSEFDMIERKANRISVTQSRQRIPQEAVKVEDDFLPRF